MSCAVWVKGTSSLEVRAHAHCTHAPTQEQRPHQRIHPPPTHPPTPLSRLPLLAPPPNRHQVFFKPNTLMLFGDAKAVSEQLKTQVCEALGVA